MNKTYNDLKEELQKNYPMVAPYHYWIISSPLIYPSVCVYNDESTRVFNHGERDFDISRLTDIGFENCTVYQCDGKGESDHEGHDLSEFVKLEPIETKTYEVKFVFDCTQYGAIYRTITCAPDNFSAAYHHELMLARIPRNLCAEEPSILLSKEEV